MFDVDLFGETPSGTAHGSLLSQSWDYPPFSVLNARDGWWQERKRQWLALGIRSELGRGGVEAFEAKRGLQTFQKDKKHARQG